MEKQKSNKKHRTDGREGVYTAQRVCNRLLTALFAVLLAGLICFGWGMPMTVSGDSMADALQEGDIVVADRLAKFYKTPSRGDMVVFYTAEGTFIKRIVALPGETVELVGGHVFIDSRPLDESAYASNFVGDMPPVTVPDASVFVLGDNRRKMYDSRMETLGCIPYESISGVMRLRLYPLSRFTLFY